MSNKRKVSTKRVSSTPSSKRSRSNANNAASKTSGKTPVKSTDEPTRIHWTPTLKRILMQKRCTHPRIVNEIKRSANNASLKKAYTLLAEEVTREINDSGAWGSNTPRVLTGEQV